MSQAELAAIFNAAREGIVAFSDDLRVRLMNPAAAQMHQCDADGAVGRPMIEFVPARVREKATRVLLNFLASENEDEGFIDDTEQLALRLDGSEFPVMCSLVRTFVNGKQFGVLMFRELSAIKASAVVLRDQSAMLNEIRDAIVLCDMDDRIVSWNRGAEEFYGVPAAEAVGRNAVEIIFPRQPEIWHDSRATVLTEGSFVAEVSQVIRGSHDIMVKHRRSPSANIIARAALQ